MNTISKQVFSLILLSQSESFLHAQHLNFNDMFDEMQKSMRHMQELFAQSAQNSLQGGVQITVEQKEKSALIIAKGLETTAVDATVNDEGDNLAIKTDHGLIKIDSEYNYIGINWQHKQEQEVKNKDGKVEKVTTSYAQQSFNMSLEHPLNLSIDQLKLDYDKENKTLTIEIPFVMPQAPEKGRKQVPVSFKSSSDQTSSK
jgi:hypothetical protein